ncbi:tetratricopeptide repeat protein [Streptomyces sp. WMMC500]|uniref:tetratricopeptide repeat protein n=1 Tax=Streptomyces sp. WMMC500 TaxID=3015154 RepID=UPI00248B1F43|nr:tetratricopeptide repeat protein [Streptomyces sp. WMMC500]WBB61079.1 tetratricopeptide repeat protein [Streptomyces sp. WMMC500]
MEPTIRGERQGVHPFCGACTDETVALAAPDTETVNGFGTRFYGAADPCPRCGSVVKRLFMCLLFIPVWSMGRYRVITLGGSRYVGRRIPRNADNPYDMSGKDAALIAQAQAAQTEAGKTWPAPPPSRLAEHPELRGERYEEAEDYWEFGFPDRALPVYEEVLAAHEAVLPADDTATLQLRQRVAEAYLAVGRPADALALLAQTAHHLGGVLGPHHPDTRRAVEDEANASSLLGTLSNDKIISLNLHVAEVKRTAGPDAPEALRAACVLGSYLSFHSSVVQALEVLEDTLARSARTLGADHPDTAYVRRELVSACESAERRARPDDVLAAARARERLHGPEAEETLTAMRGLARLYASTRRHRGEAVDVLRIVLQRCEHARGPDDPLTAAVRRELAELS